MKVQLHSCIIATSQYEAIRGFRCQYPPPKPIFRFWRGCILKFFTGLFLKGGILSKILRKNAKCGGACSGLLIIVPSAQALIESSEKGEFLTLCYAMTVLL